MSVIFQSSEGFVVCHQNYLQQLYGSVRRENVHVKLEPHPHLFDVNTPYMRDAEAKKKAKADTVSPNSQALKRKFSEISTEKHEVRISDKNNSLVSV